MAKKKPAADPRLPHKYTDQGLAQERAKRRAKGVPKASGISVQSRDEPAELERRHARNAEGVDFGRQLEQREAALDGEIELYEAPDVMSEMREKHGKPGMVLRPLSPFLIEQRGWRGWKPVTDEKGNPVRVGKMILGEMPEKKAALRRKHYEDKARQDLRDIRENFDASAEKAERDSEGGVRRMQPGEIVTGNVAEHDGVATIGSFTRQGNEAQFVGER